MTVANDSAEPTVAIDQSGRRHRRRRRDRDRIGVRRRRRGHRRAVHARRVAARREDTAAPYEVNWGSVNAANGAARGSPPSRVMPPGYSTTAAAVSVTVANDTAAPTVAVTTPGDRHDCRERQRRGRSIRRPRGRGVQFIVDGAPLGEEDIDRAVRGQLWNPRRAANGSTC